MSINKFEEVGKKIKQIRKLKGFTQEYMAEKMNTQVANYALLENGKRKISIDSLKEITDILDVDVNALMTDTTSFICIINETGVTLSTGEIHNTNNTNQYNDKYYDELIKTKDDLIEQQKQQIQLLQDMVNLLKQNLTREKTKQTPRSSRV